MQKINKGGIMKFVQSNQNTRHNWKKAKREILPRSYTIIENGNIIGKIFKNVSYNYVSSAWTLKIKDTTRHFKKLSEAKNYAMSYGCFNN